MLNPYIKMTEDQIERAVDNTGATTMDKPIPPRHSDEWKAFVANAIQTPPSQRTAEEKTEINWAITNQSAISGRLTR